MLYLLALRQVIALNWGTLTHHASSYITSLSPTKPNLTFYHRVRVHMSMEDLNHEMTLMIYPDMREDKLSTLEHLFMCLAGRQLTQLGRGRPGRCRAERSSVRPHLVQLHCRPYPPHGFMFEATVGSQGCAA